MALLPEAAQREVRMERRRRSEPKASSMDDQWSNWLTIDGQEQRDGRVRMYNVRPTEPRRRHTNEALHRPNQALQRPNSPTRPYRARSMVTGSSTLETGTTPAPGPLSDARQKPARSAPKRYRLLRLKTPAGAKRAEQGVPQSPSSSKSSSVKEALLERKRSVVEFIRTYYHR